jgi:hypothetical protein
MDGGSKVLARNGVDTIESGANTGFELSKKIAIFLIFFNNLG